MAIYSLHHSAIGKTTQAKPHTSAAHVRYITRSSAASRIEAARMPGKAHKAAAFMVEAENADRKNARVADKLMLALPRELDGEQRALLVREFAEAVTEGRAPWLAAFHDKGKDAQNPHAHLVIRDRDPDTGKRVVGLSEKGTTHRLRQLWEEHANRALEQAGKAERIDRRTLKAQGIAREPTVHEGPRAQQMDRRGARARSHMRRYRNRPGARRSHREIDYEAIDKGRSRPDYNRGIREEAASVYWEAIDDDRQVRELEQLRLIHRPPALVDLALVAGAPVEEARQGIMDEDRALFAGLYEPHVDKKEAHSPRKVTQKSPESASHGEIYHRLNKRGKGMGADKRKEELQEQIAAAEEKLASLERKFNGLLEQSYQDGTTAREKMDAFLEKHGYQELLVTIRADGNEFGLPPDDPGLRNDAGKHRDDLYLNLDAYWKLTDRHDELKAALERLQAQQGSGSAPGGTPGAASSSASDKKPTTPKPAAETKPQAAPAKAPSAGQKSPAEIQAYMAAMKAKREEEMKAEQERQAGQAQGNTPGVEDGDEPEPK